MNNTQKSFFKELLTATDGDYILQAQLAKAIKPEGW
jgi:hypothetical protein